jgi:hypothetical protein
LEHAIQHAKEAEDEADAGWGEPETAVPDRRREEEGLERSECNVEDGERTVIGDR